VIVNGRCDATVEHCRRSGGGLWFEDRVEFEVIVDRLLDDGALWDHLAGRGGGYARRQFSWPSVIDRYAALAERILNSTDADKTESARPAPL